jgi:hypothetical protein
MPPLLIALRFQLLTNINGDEGIQLPNTELGVEGDTFKWLYNHQAAHGRSKQTNYGLSDFFWYLLAPAHAVHQEHIESSDTRYKITGAVTRKLLTVSEERLAEIATKYATELFSAERLGKDASTFERERLLGDWEKGFMLGRIRDLFFPLFERMIFELLFDRVLPDSCNKIITTSAENVLNGIKGTDTRKMHARRELCDYVLTLLEPGGCPLTNGVELDPSISTEEWALFLQGVFFTTGVVQLAEGMAHVAMALAQHPAVLQKLRRECAASVPLSSPRKAAPLTPSSSLPPSSSPSSPSSPTPTSTERLGRPEPLTMPSSSSSPSSPLPSPSSKSSCTYLDHTLREVLRVWPLFGIAHRITSEDIQLPAKAGAKAGASGSVLPKGSVLCFNYPKVYTLLHYTTLHYTMLTLLQLSEGM